MENKIEKRNDVNDAFGLVDPFFSNFFDLPFYSDKRVNRIMKTDVKENEKGYQLSVEVPGFNKNQITLDLDDGYLTISAHEDKNNDEKDKNGKFLRKERFSGSYQRSFYVGDIKEEDVSAELNNGVLSVFIPKENKPENTKKIIQIK